MWNKAPLLLLRVRAPQGEKRGVRFSLLLAGYALTGALLSWEPLLSLIPAPWGQRLRAGLTSILALLWAAMACPPQEYLRVELSQKGKPVWVLLRTLGPGEEGSP